MAKNKTNKEVKHAEIEVKWVEEVKEPVKEVVNCPQCGGQGLKDTTQLCGVCAGTGKCN